MQSRGIGSEPLSAPPMTPQAAAPPPAAGTRLAWPAPPGGAPNAGEQPLSDTVERMLRPQGLFQNPQPKPFDWQQPWAAPAIAGAAGGPPPPNLDSTMPHPPPAPGGGQYPAPNGAQYPPGPQSPAGPQSSAGPQHPPGPQYPPGPQFQTTALLQSGGPTPPGAGYPQGQYGPGQYGPGQSPTGQYAPAQYGADQYGQYGPGSQYGPDGLPLTNDQPPRKLGGFTRPRGPLVPAIVVAALVVVVALAVIFSTRGNTSLHSATASTGAKTGATPAASSSGSSSSLTQGQAAGQLSGLLAQSGTDRAKVNTAYFNVQACGKGLGGDAQTFSTAAASRQALLTRLAQLPGRSALSPAMVADLTAAWQASATVDTDLGKWASAAAGHCRKGNPRDPSLIASAPYDSQATTNKQAFARLWNRLARRDGLSTVTVDQL